MKTFVMTIAAAGAMAAAALGFAGTASAAGGADAAINGLQSQGYTVRLNGSPTAPLTACTVTDVQKDDTSGTSLTAYVEVSCPNGC